MHKIVVANWKMNPLSEKEARVLFEKSKQVSKKYKNSKIIVCPPFPFLFIGLKNTNKSFFLGSQNVAPFLDKPLTGEISPLMLKNMGVSHTIVGHSERRSQGESNKVINEKILNLLKFKLIPILCVGETKRDKDGFYLSLIGEQIKTCLLGVSRSNMNNIIIAYEPIWAIGKNAEREATFTEFVEIKIYIKKILSDIYGGKIAHSVPILYGGSVNPMNALSFIQEGEADGLLVGRDSLNSKKFEAIIKAVN